MLKLLKELKRRKVLTTLGVYGAAVLIIIQVADIVFPRLLLPDWTATFVIILLILGFPIVFFFSWTYDLQRDVTPEYQKDSVSEFMEHAQSAEPTAKTESPITNNSNHIPENEKTDYREDEKRLDHLHKYYYIHEIIEEYNQHIR